MPAKKSAIAFGPIYFPVKMEKATQDNDIKFNWLHKKDNSRVGMSKACKKCGEPLQSADIVDGYQFEPDKYVIISDEDIEKIKTKKDRSIHLTQCAHLNEISPVYFDETYQLYPDTGSEKAYELFRAAMMELQIVGIAQTVMGKKESLMALIPREEGFLLQIMYYHDEIKALTSPGKPALDESELNLTKQVLQSLIKPFDPSQYKDEFQERLKELITQKIEDREIIAAENNDPEPSGGNIIDLMERFMQDQTKKPEVKPKPRRKAKEA